MSNVNRHPTAAELRDLRYAPLLGNHAPQQLDRLFLISLRRKYLYCPVSKVANSSIKAFLYEAELRNNGFAKTARDFNTAQVHNLLFGPLLQPYQLPGTLLDEVLYGADYLRFLFVRHPVDRLVSCYLDRVKTAGSVPNKVIQRALGVTEPDDIRFGDFVGVVAGQEIKEMNPHWRPVYYEACCDKLSYDRVLRFENLHGDLKALLAELYPRVAKSIDVELNLSPAKTQAGGRVAEFVTPEIRKTIEEIYAKDFEAFSY